MRLAKNIFIISLGALALIGCKADGEGILNRNSDVESGGAGVSGKTVRSTGTADIGGAFSLVDETGAAVSEADLVGKPHLIYFGFAFCPDICPTSLQKLGAAQELMGKAGDDVGYVLMTVDPERDTPEKLAQYVAFDPFPTGLRGFTGSVEQVDKLKAAYKVTSVKRALDGGVLDPNSTDYTVDHTDIIYFMGADGKFADFFSSRSTPQDISIRVRQELMREQKRKK